MFENIEYESNHIFANDIFGFLLHFREFKLIFYDWIFS